MARAPGRTWGGTIDIIAEGKGRKFLFRLERGGKCRGPFPAAIKSKRAIGHLECAVAFALQDQILTKAQKNQIQQTKRYKAWLESLDS